jgi:hypothetical protein
VSLDSDFDAGLEPRDRELGERLRQARPVPAAGFRGGLGRRLAERDPGYGPRPRRLLAVVSSCLGGGLVLVLVSALAATGSL